jgi:hypothetical protein
MRSSGYLHLILLALALWVCFNLMYFKTHSLSTIIPSNKAIVQRTEATFKPKRVIVCGNPHGRIEELLFPELSIEANLSRGLLTFPTDLLVFGMNGVCDDDHGGRLDHHWVHDNFAGKALFINGESIGDATGPGTYQISYMNTSAQTVHVPFVSIFLMAMVDEAERQKIFIPELRPRSTRKHFMIYLTSNCVPFRQVAVKNYSDISTVHIGGKCKGKRGSNVKRVRKQEWGVWEKNHQHFLDYRFCLVMENLQSTGYITEKIMNAFLGGCIPVWYGDQEIFQIFNRKAFIYHDPLDPSAALDMVRRMEANQNIYDEMMNETILTNGDKTVEDYFSLADNIGRGKLKRQIRTMLGID